MRRHLATVVALVVVVASCTGNGADTTTSTTTTPTTTPISTTTLPTTTTSLPVPPPPTITATLRDVPLASGGSWAGPAWPATLEGVSFVDGVPPSLRDRLVAEGFVIDPSGGARHFAWLYETVYPYGGRPVFVTTDAAYHQWHLVFDKLLRDTEEGVLLPVLESMVTDLVAGARAQESDLAGTDLEDAAWRARQHLEAVATVLGLDVGPIGPLAEAEVALVEQHTERTASPTVGGDCDRTSSGCVDYSLMTPRGHYTRSEDLTRFFKAMSLLGNTPFGVDDAHGLRVGLLVARLVVADPAVAAGWGDIYHATGFLVGAADDYTPFEAAQVAGGVWSGGLGDPAPLADDDTVLAVGRGLVALRTVRIDPTRPGLRTMGVRFVLDSAIYQDLVDPVVPSRVMVTPLDLAASFGSDWAWERQSEAGVDDEYPGYLAALTDTRAVVEPRTLDDWGATVYDAWLWSLQPLWSGHGEAFPPFMRGDAWAAKSHQTGFGSYTELKHDTILYAKQALAEGELEPPESVRHWVEPDPVAFGRLTATAVLLRDGLDELGLLPGADDDPTTNRGLLTTLVEELEFLTAMAAHGLAGTPIPPADNERIGEIGFRLDAILIWTGTEEGIDPHAGLVADVFLNLMGDEVLELGTGAVNYLHVLVPDANGGFAVAAGGVYSYYEFLQPRSERLSDEEWWDLIEADDLPPRPPWVLEHLGG